jgi:hypothetical protein
MLFLSFAPSSALKMEAARSSETSLNVWQTTRRLIPEDINIRTSIHRLENLSYF